MDALLNALMALGLLIVLILIIYLIDRVNSIETETRKVVSSLSENTARLALPFMGLSGKKLWDVMTGRGADDLDAQALADLRQRYPVILTKHAEALYQEGYKDGFRGAPGEPKNTQHVTVGKGTVESWMPTAQANTLYQCGLNASQTPEAEWGPIRISMDEAGQFLWRKAQLEATSPLSEWLMPSSNDNVNGQAPRPVDLPKLDGASGA